MKDHEAPWDHPPWNGDMRGYFGEANENRKTDVYSWIDVLDGLGVPAFVDRGDTPLSVESVPLPRKDHSRHRVWVDVADPLRRAVRPRHAREQRALLASLVVLKCERMPLGGLKVLTNNRPTLKISSEALDCLLLLLRYHRPDIDDLSREDWLGLVEGASEHVSAYLASMDRMLEYFVTGMSGNKLKRAIDGVNADVEAALRKDVDGMTDNRIGDEMAKPAPESDRPKGGNSTVRGMVKRGRDHLERTLGIPGARNLVKRLRAEASRDGMGWRR